MDNPSASEAQDREPGSPGRMRSWHLRQLTVQASRSDSLACISTNLGQRCSEMATVELVIATCFAYILSPTTTHVPVRSSDGSVPRELMACSKGSFAFLVTVWGSKVRPAPRRNEQPLLLYMALLEAVSDWQTGEYSHKAPQQVPTCVDKIWFPIAQFSASRPQFF